MLFSAGLGSDDPCADGPSNPAYDPAICATVAPGTLPVQYIDPDGTPDLGDLIPCPDGSVVPAAQGCPAPIVASASKSNSWPFIVGAILLAGAGGIAYRYHRAHAAKPA